MIQDPTVFFDTAWNIGMELVRDAIWDNDRCTWQGASMEPVEGKFTATIRTFKADMYSGTSGITFFLSALYSVKKDELLKHTIEGAINHCISLYQQSGDNGFYGGKSGIAFCVIEAGTRLERPDWIKEGLAILTAIEPKITHPYETDIMAGIAGTIHGLLYGFNISQDVVLLDNAVKLGNILCDMAEKSEHGWGWVSIPGKPVLTGLSHGIAGISGALLELYHITNNEQYLHAATEGIKCEQLFYHPTLCNWPDFREGIPATPDKYIYGVAWCTGAPGLALSRLRSTAITGDKQYDQQAWVGLNTTYMQVQGELTARGPSTNFSLCHGLAGNADVLLESGASAYRNAAASAGLYGIENYVNASLPWPSGVLNRQKNPGLMLGLAGTGYFYLRLWDSAFKTILLPPYTPKIKS
jgi:lantibiotic modifying enzyme